MPHKRKQDFGGEGELDRIDKWRRWSSHGETWRGVALHVTYLNYC